MNYYDVIVIGGGQAGLSIGYYLKKAALSFIILDKGSEVGEVWRNRYDSLTLFTPNFYCELPGSKFTQMKGLYPTKDEVADYLQQYAKEHELPIQHQTEVLQLEQVLDGFYIKTNKGDFHSKKVIIATGPFQKPFIPNFSQALSNNVLQLHSSEYKNPEQLRKGPVLIVGGGNSGAQIAVELYMEREVYLSVGHKLKFMPLNVGGKSVFWYIKKLGLYRASKESFIGRKLQKLKDPILGSELKPLLERKTIKLKPRTVSIQDDIFHFEDGTQLKVSNVIWSTGFQPEYDWIQINGLFDSTGAPIHERGATPVEGLYFIGLPWLHSRNSALLGGVGEDAEYLVNQILKQEVNEKHYEPSNQKMKLYYFSKE